MIYGSETWSITKILEKKLAVAQRAVERSMIEIKRTDKIKNEHIRKQTKLVNISRTIKKINGDG